QRLAEGELAAGVVRVGHRQHVHQEGVDLAHVLGRARRLARLPGGDAGRAQYGEGRQRRQRAAEAMAAHELAQAVGRRIRVGQYRAAVEVAADVVGQLLSRAVAALDVLVHGPGDDALEVAVELGPEARAHGIVERGAV